MSAYDYVAEMDEVTEDFDSDESFEEWNGAEDFGERRPRFRLRKPPRINPGKVARPGGLVRPPAPTGKVVTRAEFNAGMARVDKKIETNAEAIKKVSAQANTITSQLAAATTRLDKSLAETRKEVKRQADTSLLLMLLNKPPAIKATTTKVATPQGETTDAITAVEYEKQNNLLPLVLMMGSGGLGGSGDNSNMLLLALALSDKL